MDRAESMKTLALRFRDLNIPDGETIRRHRARIATHGSVWWGWIMRQRESFPGHFLAEWDQTLERSGGATVLLFNSGEERLYSAKMTDVAAYPEGNRIQTPEVQKTPGYMAEAECPAWFQLSEISPLPIEEIELAIVSFPTLAPPANVDQQLLGRPLESIADLRLSTATLWHVEVRTEGLDSGDL